MPGGIGRGAFGGAPWGGAEQEIKNQNATEVFDLFCFQHCQPMLDVLADPIITITGAGNQFVLNYPDPPPPPTTNCDLGILSGDLSNPAFPTLEATLQAEPVSGINSQYTIEWGVRFEALPQNFADLTNRHVYLGGSDGAGPVAGIFVSKVGIAYTGSVHFLAGNLVTDAPVQVIPGSAQFISENTDLVIRLAVDGVTGTVYLFVTELADIPVTGHRLVAILPAINADDVGFPPIDQSIISIRGLSFEPSRAIFDRWCMASTVLVPNLPPVANAGSDQASRICGIVLLDGRASFDPEGSPLLYLWKLTDGPATSAFVISGYDGRTYPQVVPTGFTDKFHSTSLGLVHAADNLDNGDVLRIGTDTYKIVNTGSDVNGFFALIDSAIIPDNLSTQGFRVLRQRGISNATTAQPSFLPDVPGFYRFELLVNDGVLSSTPAVVVVNVVDTALPRGIIPRVDFVFDFISDFWDLLEDREIVTTMWSAMAQVAATELYNLWQVDYNKSLRDIQRTFIRRWLHYDLLLAEPLSALTTVRALYSGRLTTAIPGGGANISGTSFVISSELHPAKTITIVSGNPVTAQTLAMELQNRLWELDDRYSTQVITQNFASSRFVRIDAPFPFTITNSTVSVLQNGSSDVLSGTGTAAGTRSYRVDVSLEGLDIQEDDLFILNGEAYRIASVASDPSDGLPFQRIVLKDEIPTTGTPTWIISGYVHSELLDFYNGLVTSGDEVYFHVAGLGTEDDLLRCEAFGVAGGSPSNLAFDPIPLGGKLLLDQYEIRLAKIIRRTYLPVDPLVVDVPTLSETIEIENDEATLRRNVDFFVDTYRGRAALRFEGGRFGGDDVWEGEPPPTRLWAEYTYLSNGPTIENNFGVLAEVSQDQIAALPNAVDYLSAVRGIWYAYVNGPTMRNLRVGAQILLGLPFAEEVGTIEEVRNDFSPNLGRILIRDTAQTEIVRSYTYPSVLDLEINPATGERYKAGDSVTLFAPLVEGVEIVDYVKDPTWFVGLINQGVFEEVEKYFKFLIRVNSAAFSLSALNFVRDFILRIKPTYTYPFFVVQSQLTDTEIQVTDQVSITTTLKLTDGICGVNPSSTIIDDARSGGGGIWNQVDTDSDSGSPPPTFPIPDSPVEWAVDRFLICPRDVVTAHICQLFGSPTVIPIDSVFVVDEPLMFDARFQDSGPFVVPNGATGVTITPQVGNVPPLNGTITGLGILITGGPGSDPVGYTLVIAINGVDTITQNFTSDPLYTDFTASVSQAVTAGQTLTVRIRHAGGAPRNPAWTNVRISLSIEDGAWVTDQVLQPGNYCGTRTLAS